MRRARTGNDPGGGVFDTHLHLDQLPAEAQVLGEAWEGALVPGLDLPQALRARERFGADPRLRFALGLHPWWLAPRGALPPDPGDDPRFAALGAALAEGGWAAVGETGLDRPYAQDAAVLAVQGRWFDAHMALAARHRLPVVLHCVRAHGLAQGVARSQRDVCGVVHAYGGSVEEARVWVGLGWCVGIGVSLTWPDAHRVREVAAWAPWDALVVETDAPYQSVHGTPRGEGEPAGLGAVLRALAALRGVSLEEAQARTAATARRLFGGGGEGDVSRTAPVT